MTDAAQRPQSGRAIPVPEGAQFLRRADGAGGRISPVVMHDARPGDLVAHKSITGIYLGAGNMHQRRDVLR